MLASLKPAVDFSKGCAHPAMQPPIPTTHATPQRTGAGAPLPGLRTEVVDHTLRYRGRRFILG
jgi:hypothetical protein